MGRASTISDDKIFAAVGRALARDGTLTLQQLVADTGVSIGSLYHRYASREGLLAATWLDAVEAFQHQFLSALDDAVEDAGEQAALATPRFCREQPERAIVLSCCRQSEFLSAATSPDVRKQIRTVNDAAQQALRGFAKKRGVSIEVCQYAMVGMPLGVVRIYLPHSPVPQSVDDYIRAAYRAMMSVKT